MSEMYARHDGTMEDMLRVIKTATDWQATHIVLVGAKNVAALAPELHERWLEYQIPMSVAPGAAESVVEASLLEPPFEGLTELPEPVQALLEEHDVVVYNEVLRSYREVPMSDAI